jgi:hypothetical protein
MEHAQQAALLGAIATSGDYDGFSAMMERCGATQRKYEAAKAELEAHRRAHGC